MFVSVKTIASNAALPSVAGVNTILNRSSSQRGDRKSLLVGGGGGGHGDDDDNDDDDADLYTLESSQHSSSLRGGGSGNGGGGITSNSSNHNNSNSNHNRKRTYSDDGDTNKRGGVVGGVVNGVNGVVGGVVGSGMAVVGGVVGGSKAVAGGVVGGGKAVVGGVGRGGKAVVEGVVGGGKAMVGGVVGGGKAVVGGVVGGGKTLVDGVNQSATSLTKSVDDVLNRSAKKMDDFANRSAKTIQGSANKVVGGVVGVGSSVVGSVVGSSSSLLGAGGGSTRNLKRANSTQNVKPGGSNRNLLSALLSSQGTSSENARGDGDGDRSVATTKTATKSSSKSTSSSSKVNRRMSALGRTQEMGYGSHDDTDADPIAAPAAPAAPARAVSASGDFTSSTIKSKKVVGRGRSAFGAVPDGYCSSEEKPDTTSTSTITTSTTAKGKTSGAEMISAKMGNSAVSSYNDDDDMMGYGDDEDDRAAMIAPSSSSKAKKVGRRRSVFGAITEGYCSSEEEPPSSSINKRVGKKSRAEIISGKMGGSSGELSFVSGISSDDDDMGYGGDAAAPSSSSKTKAVKKVGRRRSAFGSVSGGYCSSEEKPANKAVVGKTTGAEIVSGRMVTSSGKGGDGGGGTVSSDDDMGYGDDATTPSLPKAKKKAGRRRSAFGATAGGYVSGEEMKVGAKPGTEAIPGKKGNRGGTVSSEDDMGYGDAAPLPPKANKTVSRRRASAFGATPGGYCSFDEDDLHKEEDPVAPIEPLGHSSCHGDLDSTGKAKRIGRRKSAFGAVPGGFVADNNTAIQFIPNLPPINMAACKSMDEQDGEQSATPMTETASPPPPPPLKAPKMASKSKEEQDVDCSSPVATTSPTLKSSKKEPNTPKKTSKSNDENNAQTCMSSKCKTKSSDGATEGKSPRSLKSTGAPARRKMVKLTKEEVEGLKDLGQQEICEASGKKVIRVKRRTTCNKMSEADGANAVAAMGGTAAEATTNKDGRKFLKFIVKRKDKATDNDAECDNKSVGGRSIGGTLNPMNFFKKNSGDGSPATPATTKKSSVAGMFKLRPSNDANEMSPRSLKSVSGRQEDDKSIRSVRSTATNRTTKTAKSGAGRVLAKAKSWFKNPLAGNARKPDEYGCFDDDITLFLLQPIPIDMAHDTLGLPLETTGSYGPPTEILAKKNCSVNKRQMAPVTRAAIVQKQWLAGGTNYKTSIITAAATSHDDSDSDNSAHHGPEGDNAVVADDVSEISFDQLPIRTLPVHFTAVAHQPTEVEFWKNVCEERTKRYGTKHRLTADAYLCKGNAELCVQDYKVAVKSLSKGVSYLHLLYGDAHPSIARGLHLLGAAACFNGQLTLAEKSTLSAFEMRRNALGVCHVDTIDSFANLGMIYFKMENLPEAGRIFSELVQLRMAVFGKPHPSIAFANRALAQVFASMSEMKKAQKYYVKALKTFDKLEMIRDLNETEAEMNKFGIEIPLKVKEESTATTTATTASATSEDPGQRSSTMFAV